MARRDAVQFQLEVAAEVMRICPRMTITWEPNWEKLGNGTSANYEGGVVHHTASPSSLQRPFPTQGVLHNGRAGLPGPLCNWAGPACTVEAPWLHVMAANPANHAGASGGRSMGPLPKTSLFNPVVVGLEIDYAGTVAMLAGQLFSALVWALAVSRVLGRPSAEWIRAHAETSVTGKWDPGYAPDRTIDMAAFRRDAWNITDLEDDMPSAKEIADEVFNRGFVRQGEYGAPGAGISLRNVVEYWAHFTEGGIQQNLLDTLIEYPVDITDAEGHVLHAKGEKVSLRTLLMWQEPREVIDRQAILAAVPAAPGSAPAAGAFDYAELAKHIQLPSAAQIAAEVVALQNRQARDGDPATGPSS